MRFYKILSQYLWFISMPHILEKQHLRALKFYFLLQYELKSALPPGLSCYFVYNVLACGRSPDVMFIFIYTSALRCATMLSRCKVCLLGDMNAQTSDKHDDKHIVEEIAGEIEWVLSLVMKKIKTKVFQSIEACQTKRKITMVTGWCLYITV